MNHKGFYIVGGVLLVVGVYLYYAKNQNKKPNATSTESIESNNDNAPILGGQSATIPPMTVPKGSDINTIVKASNVGIKAGAGLKNLTQEQIIASM
jgi:hypothetical protein